MKRNTLAFVFLCCSVFLSAQQKFTHRGYLGWIRDLSTLPTVNDPWPSVKTDQQLEIDYTETLDFLQKREMNEITLWGLFTAKSWEPDVEQTVDSNRKRLIRRWIKRAHQRGLKAIAGLGLYSWGFDKIMKTHPGLVCPCNTDVMDPSNPDAWAWQQKVLDFILRFDFDGVSMQSADKGRCSCGAFAKYSDLKYHALLNQRAVQYIRSKKPEFIIGIAGWGMDFSRPGAIQDLQAMTKGVDYLIDVGETAARPDSAYRKKLIDAIRPCHFGTVGSPNVEPIQAMQRDRYFIPTYYRAARRLQALYRDGGRACETYYRTRGNPGDEATVEVLAIIENNAEADIQTVARQVSKELYQPADSATLNALEQLFHDAEDAYFSNNAQQDIILVSDRDILTTDVPQYLKKMTGDQQKTYAQSARALYARAVRLLPSVRQKEKMKRLIRCLAYTVNDLAVIRGIGEKVKMTD